MNVVMLSNTPLAGAPYENAKCLRKYTDIDVHWISLKDRYADGRVFPHDLLWEKDKGKCIKLIRKADIIHLHNEAFPFPDVLKRKRVLMQFHSVPKRASFSELFKEYTINCYTVDQPLQRQVYEGLPVLPNMLDPEEYTPLNEVSGHKIKIVFAPTNTWGADTPGSKAYKEVTQVLKEFSDRADIDIFSNLSYFDNLARKRQSDILIDDVANNTFHKTTLEGCCFGVCVITGYENGGWITARVHTLREVLKDLLENPEKINQCKQMSRAWVEREWHPKNLVGVYLDAYRKMLS